MARFVDHVPLLAGIAREVKQHLWAVACEVDELERAALHHEMGRAHLGKCRVLGRGEEAFAIEAAGCGQAGEFAEGGEDIDQIYIARMPRGLDSRPAHEKRDMHAFLVEFSFLPQPVAPKHVAMVAEEKDAAVVRILAAVAQGLKHSGEAGIGFLYQRIIDRGGAADVVLGDGRCVETARVEHGVVRGLGIPRDGDAIGVFREALGVGEERKCGC